MPLLLAQPPLSVYLQTVQRCHFIQDTPHLQKQIEQRILGNSFITECFLQGHLSGCLLQCIKDNSAFVR